jgi:hypothetical protein
VEAAGRAPRKERVMILVLAFVLLAAPVAIAFVAAA